MIGTLDPAQTIILRGVLPFVKPSYWRLFESVVIIDR